MGKRAYKKADVERLRAMSCEELVESFVVVCNVLCNEWNFTRRGPSNAMHEDYAAHHAEIMRRMREV